MKVVHVTLRFDAPGGVETNVRELARRTRAAGDDVEVFASDLYDEASWVRRSDYRPEVDGVQVRRFAVRRYLLPGLKMPTLVGLVDALAESGADVIHAHSHRYAHVLQAAAVASRTGTPLVISTSYHPADSRESGLQRALLRLDDHAFGMTAYRTASAIAVQSEHEAEVLRGFAPADRVRIIPPGIDLEEWTHPAADRATSLGLPEGYLVFVGRIAPNKGLTNLVEALAALPAAERPPLVLMGADWGERARLEALARQRGVLDRLTFLGHIPDRSTYRAVLRGARALVLPSEWEAYGFVLLEAMAAGTPIVATSVGAVPEVLGHGRRGALVPYGDVPALAAALRAVVQDPSTAEHRVRAGTEHVAQLDWSVSVQRFRDLYREVVRG